MTDTPTKNHYLDYNASAPLRPAVVDAMNSAICLVGNPSSVHKHGQEMNQRIRSARDTICRTIGAHNSKVVFTSGGTESNNLALRGCDAATTLVSQIEHDSVLAAAKNAPRIPVKSDGVVDLNVL